MAEKPEVTVTYQPALIRIDGDGQADLQDGRDQRVSRPRDDRRDLRGQHLHPLWPHGRVDDNTVVLFGNMDDVLAVHRALNEGVDAAARFAASVATIRFNDGRGRIDMFVTPEWAKRSSWSTGTPISGTAARRTSATSTASSSSSASTAITAI